MKSILTMSMVKLWTDWQQTWLLYLVNDDFDKKMCWDISKVD